MKKKTLGVIAIFAFALCMISTCLLSGTLAKYTTADSGTGTVTVANFTDIESIAGQTSETKNFNIGTTKWANDKVNTGKIAPGDKGSFDIVLEASEVAYTYTLVLSPVQNGIPIKFTDSEGDLWVNETVRPGNIGGQTITIYWEWDSLSDAADIAAETHAGDNTFTVTLTAEQVVGSPIAPAPVGP